ncbi:MAG: Uma2 family endonuclease [Gemmatimonadota bacterium]|nr:Uma2 family endonuclease [Gemmatimonadota bacterium]
MAAPMYYTAETVRALPEDGNRYEVVYGELLVTPAPSVWHEVVQVRLRSALWRYLERQSLELTIFGPLADISWGRDDVLLSPDILVIPTSEARTLDWLEMRTLQLVVEVLSPSTARYDRFTKRRVYQAQGVPLYWLVDGDRHEVEVWTPEATFPAVERERLMWRPEGAHEAFTLELAALFRPV